MISLLAVLFLGPIGCAPTTDRDARLAGVGTARDAPSPKPVPHFTGGEFITADGTVLPLREWLPEGRPKAVILALHGFDDYSRAFSGPAKAWAKLGIATYAYDQRGFGAAPDRGFWPGTFPLVADAATASRVLRKLYPGIPLYLLGESMGGAVAAVAMSGESGAPRPDVDGVILAAPAVWGRATMGPVKLVTLWVAVRLFPGWRLTGRGLGILPSDNIPMLRELSRDPLVIHSTRVDTLYGLVNLMGAALRSAPRLDMPLLVLYGAKDELIPKHAMRLFVRELPREPSSRLRLAYYKNGYHMLLRDLEAPLLFKDVASWIFDPKAPLPSRADRAAATFFGRH